MLAYVLDVALLIYLAALMGIACLTGLTFSVIRSEGHDIVTHMTLPLAAYLLAAIGGGYLWAEFGPALLSSLLGSNVCAKSDLPWIVAELSLFTLEAPFFLGIIGFARLLMCSRDIQQARKADALLLSHSGSADVRFAVAALNQRATARIKNASWLICGAAFQVFPMGAMGAALVFMAIRMC